MGTLPGRLVRNMIVAPHIKRLKNRFFKAKKKKEERTAQRCDGSLHRPFQPWVCWRKSGWIRATQVRVANGNTAYRRENCETRVALRAELSLDHIGPPETRHAMLSPKACRVPALKDRSMLQIILLFCEAEAVRILEHGQSCNLYAMKRGRREEAWKGTTSPRIDSSEECRLSAETAVLL